jgi:hypothetical protein
MIVFGTAQPPAPAPANPRATMVFGTAASNAAAPKEPTPANAKTTMMFGSPVSAPPPAAPPKNQTMMFGTAASIAAESTGESEETVMDVPGQSSRTVLFGTGQPPAEAEPVPEPAGSQNKTMMFGKAVAIPKVTAGTVELAGYAADEDQKSESTVRVDVQQVMEGQEGEAPAASPAEPPSRQDRTQRFAMSDLSTPPAGRPASTQDRHNRTQLFAMTQDNTAPVAAHLREDPVQLLGDATLPPGDMPILSPARSGSTDLHATLPPDGPADPPGVSLLHDPANAPTSDHDSGPDQPLVMTLPNLQPIQGMRPLAPMPVELPPEPSGSPADLRATQPQHALSAQQQAAEDAAAMRAVRGGGGAGKVIVVLLILVALGLAGVLVYRLFGKQLLGQAVPVEALRTADQALATLRVDDGASQEQAIAQLKTVIAQHPNVPETQAAYVIASALRYDDVQGRALRGQERLRSLKSQEAPEKEIAAFQARLAADVAEAKTLRAELESAQARLETLKVAVEKGTSADLAVLRAEGIARGVLGDTEAIPTAEAFRQRSAVPDDWADLIEPEFALNGGSSFDEAIVQLDRVKRRESTFLRPYVLLARLQLKKGDVARARAELEQVSTMNSRHEIAQELLSGLP